MPLLKTEADKLSNNDLVAGIIEEIIDKEDLFAVLPFVQSKGKAYVYNREKTLSEASFLDPNEAVPEGAATFDEIVTKLRILAGDVDVDKFIATTMDDVNDQVAIQIASKAKGLARKFRRTLAIGDNATNAKEFDGVAKLVSLDQTVEVAANGGALTLALLDELLDKVPNGADVLMMRPGTIRAYKQLLRATGSGTDAAMLQLDNFGRPVLGHSGVPIIENEFLPGDEDQGTTLDSTCSVYAIRLNESDGMHGIYGGEDAGIRVEALGTVQNKDAWRFRVKWYVALALKSTKSLARLKGVTNI